MFVDKWGEVTEQESSSLNRGTHFTKTALNIYNPNIILFCLCRMSYFLCIFNSLDLLREISLCVGTNIFCRDLEYHTPHINDDIKLMLIIMADSLEA